MKVYLKTIIMNIKSQLEYRKAFIISMTVLRSMYLILKQENMYGKSARKIIMILELMHSGLTTLSLITVYMISTITATLQVLLSPALIFIRSFTAAFSMTT